MAMINSYSVVIKCFSPIALAYSMIYFSNFKISTFELGSIIGLKVIFYKVSREAQTLHAYTAIYLFCHMVLSLSLSVGSNISVISFLLAK